MPLTLPELLAATAVVTVAAAVQGAVGFGSALLAAPILVLIDPLLIPGPMIFAGIGLTVSMVVREHHAIDRQGLVWALAGSFLGAAAGGALVASVAKDFLGLLLGVAVLIAVVATASGLHVRRTGLTLTVAGLLSGFMGTTTSVGGPPMALAYQHAGGPEIRATLSTYFAINAVFAIGSLTLAGAFGRTEFFLGLALLPGIILGLLLSGRARPILDGGYTRLAILLVAGGAAVVVLVRALL